MRFVVISIGFAGSGVVPLLQDVSNNYNKQRRRRRVEKVKVLQNTKKHNNNKKRQLLLRIFLRCVAAGRFVVEKIF